MRSEPVVAQPLDRRGSVRAVILSAVVPVNARAGSPPFKMDDILNDRARLGAALENRERTLPVLWETPALVPPGDLDTPEEGGRVVAV